MEAERIREGIGVLATPTDADDHRSLGNRQACALKEVFADALGPNGLVTDTRQNQNQNAGARRRADAEAMPRPTPSQRPTQPADETASRTR